MQDYLTLNHIARVDGNINLPGSKSISNRALLLAAQAVGTTRLINLLNSDDVHYMLISLSKLGITYRLSADRRICEIDGLAGPLHVEKILKLFIGNAGTVMRTLTAALCLKNCDITLTGEPRMKERPIGHLVEALRQGGAKIDYLDQKNYPPIRLRGGYQGGNITLDSSISSQFLTALLMMAPMAPQDSCIHIKSKLVSQPYIDITLAIMKSFSIEVRHDNYQIFYINGGNTYHSPGDYLIEGDASNASYFLAAAAICGGTVRVTGIDCCSIQGDIHFANILEKMGATIRWGDHFIECTRSTLHAIDMDMNAIPDAAMTIATTSLFSTGGTTTLRNIHNWRIKESDRLKAMSIELRKVGANVIEGEDYLAITPPIKMNAACINTYNDHRIAMSFALLAMSNTPVTILNPQCTHKTFPDFFAKLSILSMPTKSKYNPIIQSSDNIIKEI